jgi:hypothetical protein
MSDRVLTVVGCENDSLLPSKVELNLTVESIYLYYLKTKLYLFSEPKMHRAQTYFKNDSRWFTGSTFLSIDLNVSFTADKWWLLVPELNQILLYSTQTLFPCPVDSLFKSEDLSLLEYAAM